MLLILTLTLNPKPNPEQAAQVDRARAAARLPQGEAGDGRYGELWGALGSYGEIWGDLGRSREIWGDMGSVYLKGKQIRPRARVRIN